MPAGSDTAPLPAARRGAEAAWAGAAALFGWCVTLLYRAGGWRLFTRVGRAAGRAAYRWRDATRAALLREISSIPGTPADATALDAIACRALEYHVARLVETLVFGRMDRALLERLVTVQGREHLDAALARGQGVVLLLAHFGSFLLPLPWLGFRGYTVSQVTGRPRHAGPAAAALWRWRKRSANRLPVRFIQVGSFLRPVHDALRRNEIVALAFDGRDGSQWTEVRFLGRPARFSAGPFRLARRTGAAIIPAFMVRHADDTHTLQLEPAFALPATPRDDEAQALAADTQRFADLFAGYVLRYPCHFATILLRHRRDAARGAPSLFLEELAPPGV